ncbi:1-hydroxycarotenoid 3,4-desaturase CrtD [Aureispira sp. CCB-E]|uniref:1-hydroxycarotenoid 3,4-desaturase CrtD n=1 Tax=Aureispira sp. CCB-E TaxID=3051121 RepID=UPI0028695A14|nr:1-hydroxycarotenoid 3,4-desaturase CrtD [Aureispira sp. CCB-E]WMX14565.1 1-hydroxycarotenoid 3,4-desaturase CrtD [Aureispira sp. CCB-E]
MYDAIVIGAGIAGIAVALRLKKRGDKVLVLEKNSYVGGKMNQYESMGYRWDTGPSLFTMPQLVDELYELYDKNPIDYYQYKEEEEACRYFFSDKTQLNFYTNRTKLKKELSEKLGIDTKVIDSYMERSAEKYNSIGVISLENAIHKPSGLPWGKLLKMLPQIFRTNLFTSLHRLNATQLKEPRLVQIFDRYATYNGSNPYKASGILSMIPHLEQNVGTFFPKGGMRSIVDGLYQLAKEVGIEFEFGVSIDKVEKIKKGYCINENPHYHCKRLVSAIDCVQFYKEVLKDKTLAKKYHRQERSSSAIIFYWGIQKQFAELGLHNIFFSEDYQREFELIFEEKNIPLEGTIYVHISSKVNPQDAPQDGENWFVMLNVPAGIEINKEQTAIIKSAILKRIEQMLNKEVTPYIQTEKVWTPKGIELDTGAIEGALYGAASNSKMAALTRHPNFSKKYKEIYFCGGTVHPGGGIPLSIQSAKIVDKLIANER